MDIQKDFLNMQIAYEKNCAIRCNCSYEELKAQLDRSESLFGTRYLEGSPRHENWLLWVEAWQAAKAQAVPVKLVLELEKGRFKEYEYKALLRQSLRASKVTRSKLNWVHVMSMLGTGSTVAHRICEALGVNPDGTEFKTQEPAND
ncbi:hypothetical protein [Acinetobacter variabilis]|uniref:Uncharacterized protein n=1 Tax=Acinetobacter variabilis TaxID=70346 RepID=N9MGI1_9GAMM|nr:hypothetical protein [Acinetobacter variabilis]ENX07678.1 hypothetical protein F897_02715 [Acinetobacter variabilis]UBI31635.1 hypothetical protein LA331_05640 [Acinetobacter variabilis]BCT88940.1 hypothetical protein RYU24_13450 [Acinetobacter variabilis]